MTDHRSRWCAEGVTLRQAQAAISPERWDRLALEYEDAGWDDRRAAHRLLPLTGLFPWRYDKPPRQKAVDLLLEGDDGQREVVEITSTLDSAYQGRHRHSEELAEAVSRLYIGRRSWHFSFREGWWEFIAAKPKQRRQLHEALAAELVGFDAVGAMVGEFRAVDWINAVVVESGEAGVHATGWSAGIWQSKQPYLERLSEFLATSDLIADKTRKLLNGARTLGATRLHLYLLMGSTGRHGNLMPWSPASLTEGHFIVPSGLTDLWLDGGSGEVYHWTATDDWVFHREP